MTEFTLPLDYRKQYVHNKHNHPTVWTQQIPRQFALLLNASNITAGLQMALLSILICQCNRHSVKPFPAVSPYDTAYRVLQNVAATYLKQREEQRINNLWNKHGCKQVEKKWRWDWHCYCTHWPATRYRSVVMWWHTRRNQISSFARNGPVHLNRTVGVSSVDYWQPRCAHQR